jgi:hypothetical protein
MDTNIFHHGLCPLLHQGIRFIILVRLFLSDCLLLLHALLFIIDFPLSSIVFFMKRTIRFSTLYLNTQPSILFLNPVVFILCFILNFYMNLYCTAP